MGLNDPLVFSSEHLIRRRSNGMRVDESAPHLLARKLRLHGEEIAYRALLLARRSKRKKISARDIHTAAQLV